MDPTFEDEIVRAHELEAAPIGAALRLQVLGSCMVPLFKSGDVLSIERCEASAAFLGDVVVGKNGDGHFVAHLLIGTAPVRTATLRGADDPPPITLYGRVTGVNGVHPLRPIAAALRPGLWAYQRLVCALRERPWAQSLRRTLISARDSRALSWVRRPWVLPITVRRLNFDDLQPVIIFTSGHLPLAPEFVRRQLWTRWHAQGAAAGAFDLRGRLCGFAFFDELQQEGVDIDGWWIRALFVAPRARRMGVARRLIRLLCEEADRQSVPRLRADIQRDNEASLDAFAAEGFSPSTDDSAQRFQREWARHGVHDDWTIVERTFS